MTSQYSLIIFFSRLLKLELLLTDNFNLLEISSYDKKIHFVGNLNVGSIIPVNMPPLKCDLAFFDTQLIDLN